jgi:glutamate synthase domain-containing protein 3
VRDTFGVLKESLGDRAKEARSALPTALSQFAQLLERHSAEADEHAGARTLDDWRTLLAEFERGATAIRAALEGVATAPKADPTESEAIDDSDDWARLLVEQCRPAPTSCASWCRRARTTTRRRRLPSLRQLGDARGRRRGLGAPAARRGPPARDRSPRGARRRARAAWTRASCTTARAT